MVKNIFIANFVHLLEQGFTDTEAQKLVQMKEHVEEHIEYRERLEIQHRLEFMRWLVQHDRISK